MQSDTLPDAERFLIAGYRRMAPAERVARVVALNRAVEQLARARLLQRYGAEMPEREVRLRLGALRLDRKVMIEAFDWDPQEHGY